MTLPPTVPLCPVFEPEVNPNRAIRVILVGAGGIGARVLPTLVKMLPGDNNEIFVVDPDIVEPKNLRRQPFIAENVGEYKAVVLQDRHSQSDLPVTAITDRFDVAMRSLRDTVTSGVQTFILGCVDNSQARNQMLATAASGNLPFCYIDAGNDGNRGQVIVAMAKGRSANSVRGLSRYYMVSGVDKFTEVFEPVDPKPEGCDLLDTQTPMANQMAATFVLQYVSLFLHGQLLGSCGVTFTTLGSVDYIPLVEVGTDSGYRELTAVTKSPPSFRGDSMQSWIPQLVLTKWEERKAAARLAALPTVMPLVDEAAPFIPAAQRRRRRTAADQVEDALAMFGNDELAGLD